MVYVFIFSVRACLCRRLVSVLLRVSSNGGHQRGGAAVPVRTFYARIEAQTHTGDVHVNDSAIRSAAVTRTVPLASGLSARSCCPGPGPGPYRERGPGRQGRCWVIIY